MVWGRGQLGKREKLDGSGAVHACMITLVGEMLGTLASVAGHGLDLY